MAQWDGNPISWDGGAVLWGEGEPIVLTAQDIVTGAPEISQASLGVELTAQDVVTGSPEISQAQIPRPPLSGSRTRQQAAIRVARVVNEQDTMYAQVRFYDLDAVLFIPVSVGYRVDCLTTGSEMRGWTVIVPAQSVTIPLASEDNRIVNSLNSREIRQLVVRFEDSDGNMQKGQAQYRVDNLRGVH